jgi:hypothetical protein
MARPSGPVSARIYRPVAFIVLIAAIVLVIFHCKPLISLVAVPGIVLDNGNTAGRTVLIFLMMEIEQGLRNVGF